MCQACRSDFPAWTSQLASKQNLYVPFTSFTLTSIYTVRVNAETTSACLQVSQKQVQHQCDLFRKEAEIAQQQVQDYVQQKHKREAELYVKVTCPAVKA